MQAASEASRPTIVDLGFLAAVIAGCVLPPFLFAVWVRNQESQDREPWSLVVKAFVWGGTGAVLLAVVIEVIASGPSEALKPLGVSSVVYAAVVVAPVVEEATKGLGFRWIDDDHIELEDGFVYGAAAGLGFSATENFAYGFSALGEGGIDALVATIAVRTFSSSMLHATTTAILGYAVWKRRAGEGSAFTIPALYAGAVLIHAVFNFAATLQLFVTFLAAIALAVGGFAWVRKRVRVLDQRSTG